MLRLRVTPAAGEPFERLVDAPSLIVGRAHGADLALRDRFLSRRHARLFLHGARLWIEDLGSQDGTLVNDRRIDRPVELRPGDVVRLSASVLRVEEAAEAPSPVSSETALFRPAEEILASRDAPPPPAERTAETLERYAERLRLLNAVHQALARSLGLEELLELILDRVFDHLRPEEAALYLTDPGGELRCLASRPPSAAGDQPFFSRSLAREVTEKGLAALVVDARSDERFSAAESIEISGVRSIAAAPLLEPGGTTGMIALSSRLRVRQFDEEDLALLVSLASVAALHLRNLALGDCVLMVVDVSGKGIAAALLTASVEALAAGFLEVGLPPEEVCDRVCRRLFERTPPEKYATAFIAALEPGTGRLRYASAGHNPGLVVQRDGATEALASTGPPLGLVAGARRGGIEVTLEPGDLLVVYTDGYTEAADPDGEEYGTERLAALCSQLRERPLAELARAVEQDLAGFARGEPVHDDRTLVLARRAGEKANEPAVEG